MPTSEIEKLYCQQLVKHYDKLSMSGLPERNPGLSEIPLDKVFIKLGLQMGASHNGGRKCLARAINKAEP